MEGQEENRKKRYGIKGEERRWKRRSNREKGKRKGKESGEK